MSLSNVNKLEKAIETAEKVVIIQPENPDGDSLATSLALESILSELGKDTFLHCAVVMPRHLTHLEGWDRVEQTLPRDFDIAILVDTTSGSLIERTLNLPESNKLKTNEAKTFVIDHHESESSLDINTVEIIDTNSVATGELVYKIAMQLNWKMPLQAMKMLASSILYDSLGLMTEGTSADSIRVIADLVESGVSLPELDEKRRQLMKREQSITKYKGELIQRIQYELEGQLAHIHIPWEEIEKYSDKYNPSMLVLDDMRMTEGVKLAVAFKTYPDGKLTAKIRANYGYPYASKLAEHFGGGGHPYAAGFKLQPGNIEETLNKTMEFLNSEFNNETL